MNKNIFSMIFSWVLGWVLFLGLYYFGSSVNSWNIIKSSWFGIGDYIVVAFYFTAVTLVSARYLSDYMEERKND